MSRKRRGLSFGSRSLACTGRLTRALFLIILVSAAYSCKSSSSVTYTISGTVTGLTGQGLVLQDNGTSDLPVSTNGTFTFATAINSGSVYSVTVLIQPSSPTQMCSVANGGGAANANIANVQVTCTTNVYPVSGTVSGLTSAGLVLQLNGGDNLTVNPPATFFTFTNFLISGTAYNVTVFAQPPNPPEDCVVTNGTGIVATAVTTINVTCTQGAIDTFTISGTAKNLSGTGSGLELRNNGSDPLLVNANGGFTFPTAIASGNSYSVTVAAQPSAPAQACKITNGAGIATADVTNVVVTCGQGDWTWVSGANVVGSKGTYGIAGSPALGNSPGARTNAATWTDAAGNFWLFGGEGYDVAGNRGLLNDLWQYSAGQWTWVAGSNLINQSGIYGSQGSSAPGNLPGARSSAATWTDGAGNFWLFGGEGYDVAGNRGLLNDLWEYSGGQWTWVRGSSLINQDDAGNDPGVRSNAVSWIDQAGNLWLFGGRGYDSASNSGLLNDLWRYTAGVWTRVGGSSAVNQQGAYGSQGTPTPGNFPGARHRAIAWTDSAGNFWLFGGEGYDSAGAFGSLNDFWKYSAGQWAWVAGSSVINQPDSANFPGARAGAVGWTAGGNLWLFGGVGYDSAGNYGLLDDLWEYSAGQWATVAGPDVVNEGGSYGIAGVPASGDGPGARKGSVAWSDPAGNLWLFGGAGYDSAGRAGFLNDLWNYKP